MRKSYLFVFIAIFVSSFIHAAEVTKIEIGAYELPPHLYYNTEKKMIEGTLYEFIEKEIVSSIHLKSHWVFHPFSRIFAEAESGHIHLMGFLAKNAEREKKFDFPKKPTFKTQSVLIFRKGQSIKEFSKNSLEGKKIGHTLGSIIPSFLEDKGIKFDFLAGDKSLERNLDKLNVKRLDGVFAPTKNHAEHMIKKLKLENELELYSIKESEIDLYLVVSKNAPSDLKEKILKRLEQLGDRYIRQYKY